MTAPAFEARIPGPSADADRLGVVRDLTQQLGLDPDRGPRRRWGVDLVAVTAPEADLLIEALQQRAAHTAADGDTVTPSRAHTREGAGAAPGDRDVHREPMDVRARGRAHGGAVDPSSDLDPFAASIWPPLALQPGEAGRRGALGPSYPTARPWPAEVAAWPEEARWRWATLVDVACYGGQDLEAAEQTATAAVRGDLANRTQQDGQGVGNGQAG